MADEITAVKVDDVAVGWVEYDPVSDGWQARLRGESGSRQFYAHSAAVEWVRQQYKENQT